MKTKPSIGYETMMCIASHSSCDALYCLYPSFMFSRDVNILHKQYETSIWVGHGFKGKVKKVKKVKKDKVKREKVKREIVQRKKVKGRKEKEVKD